MAKKMYSREDYGDKPSERRRPDSRENRGQLPSSSTTRRKKQAPVPVKKKKRGGLIASILVVILLASGVLGFFNVKDEIGGKNSVATTAVQIVVNEQDTTKSIAEKLKDNSLVGNAFVFRTYYSLNKKNYDNEFQVGTFNVVAGDYNSIITTLTSPPPPVNNREELTVTFPESRSAIRFAKIAEEAFQNRFTWQEFMEVANDMERFVDIPFIARLKEEGHFDDTDVAMRAEGYMAPNTYNFYIDESIDNIVRRLYTQFNTNFTSEIYARMAERGFTLRETVALASIVEAEAGDPARQPGVAGVFWNRLQPNSPYPKLGSEVTYWYLKDVLSVWYGDEASIPSNVFNAYHTEEQNTSSISGIPVGPIGAPSATAIQAVLYPEQHDYYFFLTTFYGEYCYGVTWEDHIANIAYMEEQNAKYKKEHPDAA